MKSKVQEMLWRRLEKVLVFFAALGIVAVITVQILLPSGLLNAYVTVNGSLGGAALDTSLPVVYDDTELFGNITIEIMGYHSLPQAQVLVNEKSSGNFQEKQVTVRVYAGDVVAVDASAYERAVTFRVVRASANINTSYLQENITVNSTKAKVGEVLFR